MMISAIFYCFFVICVASNVANEYCQLPCSKGPHTVCDRENRKCGPDPKCGPDFREITLKDIERQSILDLHNKLRNKVALGQEGTQPSASNMMALSYNKELESIAQCWANACNGDPLEHDACRRTSDFEYVGQNLARQSSTGSELDVPRIIETLILSWYEEVNKYDPSSVDKGIWSPTTGHYTQLVWADTSEVGCAAAYYTSQKGGLDWHNVLLACNYGPGGNYEGAAVYRVGRAASECKGGGNPKYEGLCGNDASLEETDGFGGVFDVTSRGVALEGFSECLFVISLPFIFMSLDKYLL